MNIPSESSARRPIASRQQRWAPAMARALQRCGLTPNQISVASMAFALLAGSAALGSRLVVEQSDQLGLRILCLALLLIGILGRLLCNLFDGMVAIEGGMKTAAGEIYNDVPDRISDLLIIVPLGFAAAAHETASSLWLHLGWLAGSLAILTAYLRYLGAACGVGHSFLGPLAKQQRMALIITAATASMILEPWTLAYGSCFKGALLLLVSGTVLTSIRRLLAIASALGRRGK